MCVKPEFAEAISDPLLLRSIPPDLPVTRTSAFRPKGKHRLGIGDLALRSLPYLYRSGARILCAGNIDLIFFSTTAFPVMILGPLWKKQFDIPYILDFQDPWLTDYYPRTGLTPSGGRIKFALSQAIARLLEPIVLRNAGHVVCVSPAYPEMFCRHYRWLHSARFSVLPFGAPEADFEVVAALEVKQTIFNSSDGKRHWVYVGVSGPIMQLALRAFFLALRRSREADPGKYSNLVIHFIGTDYAPGARAHKTVEPIAVDCGVGDMVCEQPHRIPYFEALRCLLDAEALIVPGSNDPSYTASKIFPYILACKPLLAIFHEQSSVVEILKRTCAGIVVTFSSGTGPLQLSEQIEQSWFALAHLAVPATDWSAVEPYTARSMTQALCVRFADCLTAMR